jgi:selenocysteine lyase/cysteine desulfurase
MPELSDLDERALQARVRADLTTTRPHFNHAGMSPTPAPALAAVRAHLEREAEIGGYEAATEAAEALAAVPAAVAPLFGPGVGADEVAVAESATRAWESALWAMAETFDWGAGDGVVIDAFTYATTYTTVERLAAARGVTVAVAGSGADGAVDIDRLAECLGPTTRLVALTHVPTHLGTVTDVDAVGRLLAGSGWDIVYALDVAQTLGRRVLDVDAIGCDLAYAPGRKFLRAPRGTGALFVRAVLAERLVPLSPEFGAVGPAAPDHFALAPAARRFDPFEFGHAAHLGLAEAARYAAAIGLDRIEGLVAARSRQVTDVLAAAAGVRLLGPPDAAGIISFRHERRDPAEVRARLGAAGVNVWVNPAGGAPIDGRDRDVLPSVRVSPHYTTDDSDLAALEAALATL